MIQVAGEVGGLDERKDFNRWDDGRYFISRL